MVKEIGGGGLGGAWVAGSGRRWEDGVWEWGIFYVKLETISHPPLPTSCPSFATQGYREHNVAVLGNPSLLYISTETLHHVPV